MAFAPAAPVRPLSLPWFNALSGWGFGVVRFRASGFGIVIVDLAFRLVVHIGFELQV